MKSKLSCWLCTQWFYYVQLVQLENLKMAASQSAKIPSLLCQIIWSIHFTPELASQPIFLIQSWRTNLNASPLIQGPPGAPGSKGILGYPGPRDHQEYQVDHRDLHILGVSNLLALQENVVSETLTKNPGRISGI